MALTNILVLLALVQLIFFAMQVGSARERHGVSAPATTGNEIFERYYRVQMNTLELMIVLIPSVWIASSYWNPLFVSAMLAIYLVGRFIYFSAYIKDPKKRGMGFMVSFVPIATLLLSGLGGAVWSIVQNGM